MRRKALAGVAVLLVSVVLLIGCVAGVSQEDYNAVVSQRDAAQAQVANLEAELAVAEAQITASESDLATAQAEVEDLEDSKSQAEAQITTLEGDLATAQAEVKDLEDSISKVVPYVEVLTDLASELNEESPLASFERNNYFYGKLMTVRDFETEQRYFTAKGERLMSLIHEIGIACGQESYWIRVSGTLDGRPLVSGTPVDYTLSGPEIITGTILDQTYTVLPGTWTLTYIGGGPSPAPGETIVLQSITPSATQTLAPETLIISFTLNFQTVQIPVQPPPPS